MSERDILMMAFVLFVAADHFRTVRRLEREAKARVVLSDCDITLACAIASLRSAERWCPPGSGFTIEGTKRFRSNGELMVCAVRRCSDG